jgi:probable HAF family extracellular repeat protein
MRLEQGPSQNCGFDVLEIQESCAFRSFRICVCPLRDDAPLRKVSGLTSPLFPLVRLVRSWDYDTPLYPMNNRFRLIHADQVRRHGLPGFPVWKSLGLICAMVCFASATFAQSRYQITRIPTPSGANSAALGLNNRGDVVGYSFQGDNYQAFLFSSADKSMTDVGSLGGKLNAACAINDAGQVTGYSQDGNGNLLAFIFSRNAPIASLGTLDGAATSEAFGIDNSGAVAGDSQSGNQNHRPVLFSNGSVQDLGLGAANEPDALETAYAINDSGQIVGRHSAGNNSFHAFLFGNGNTTDFGTLGGANGEALAINKNGQVVGDSDTANGTVHAFVFDRSLKDLGTLPGFDNASYARGINNSGDIVGESDSADQKRAFLYTKGHLTELDRLAENLNESGFASLDVAYGINDKGWIVGYGTTSDGLTAAFLAVPDRGGPNPERPIAAPPPQRGQGQPVSESTEGDYNVFYSRLSSDEGSWVEAGNYGYCFRPRVERDWRPYRDGHWVWTDRGWYWESNEHFGWATYHYGRWVFIEGTGWCWVPGHQWAPAWVSWRESDEHVGWAPLPPEADVSVHMGISSWSDSYYDIGPAAYTFIRYSHWSAPSYAQYVEPPAQNVQIISQTKNVTNIVNNNTVINNYGPQVQTVAAKTNQNIQEVKLAVNPATGPNPNYGQTLQGNQLNVVAPPPTLKPVATLTPAVQTRIANPVIQNGWQDVKPADATKLKQTIAAQNPVPKDLPKPTPVATPQILTKGQAGPPGAAGSPTPSTGQNQTPSNLLRPGAGTPAVKATPGGSAAVGAGTPPVKATPGGSPPVAGNKPMPPNLLGVKPSGTPAPSPAGAGGKATPPSTPGPKQSPTATVPGPSPSIQKSTPPNLNVPKPSPTAALKPTPTPAPKTGGVPPGESPHVSAPPRAVATPTPETKPQPTPASTPPAGPGNLAMPKPTATPHQPANLETPKPTTTPHHEPTAVSTPKPEVKTTPPPQPAVQQTPTPQPQVQHTPPPVQHTPAPQPQVQHTPPPVQHTPAPQPQVQHTPPPVQHTPAPQPPAQHTPPPVQHTPAPQPPAQHTPPPVQHTPAPQPPAQHTPPPVQHTPAPQPPAQHTPPPQGGQKHEPGKPTPTP